ncbi:MAG: ComEC/Rec2 family competence protein, partial [Tepidiformaceae bacterium]
MALVVVALVWLCSIASVALWSLPPWAVPLCGLIAVPATFLLRGRRDAVVLTAAAVIALLGATRFQHWQGSDAPGLAHYIARTVVVDGTIASEPDPGETSTSYNVRVDHIETLGYSGPTGGMLRLTVGQYDSYLPGDRVRLSGPLEPAPVFSGFNYR